MRSLLSVLVLVLATPAARAHLELLEPASRDGGFVLKIGPCGANGSTRSENVTTFPAGATIAVTFDEYIDHPGHFRIAIDLDGDDSFIDPPCTAHCQTASDPAPPEFDFSVGNEGMIVLADDIADTNGAVSTIEVTLPDVACDNCTLQVIQVMYDKRPITVGGNDVYYQCADLVLVKDPNAPDPNPVEPVTEAQPELTAEAETAPNTSSDDGCSGGGGLPSLLALALLFKRRM